MSRKRSEEIILGDFESSSWADESFANNYLEKADVFIPDRNKMFALMASICLHLTGGRKGLSICDLGCGNGAATKVLLSLDNTIRATLIDASNTMLEKARQELSGYDGLSFIKAGFDDLLKGKVDPGVHDPGVHDPGVHDAFISAQAIHHLTLKEKTSLFSLIFSRLNSPGLFINIDVVLPPSDNLEKLYFDLWAQGMAQMAEKAGMSGFAPSDVIKQYKSPESMNRPDTLHDQLDALKDAGFVDVDCFYKNGIFAVFGGRKE